MTATAPLLVREADAAKILGVRVRTMADWRLRGEGPPHIRLTGRCVRYDMRDLESFVAARRRKSTSDPGPEAREG